MKKAFSLIELTIVMGIASVLMLAAVTFLIEVVRQNNKITIENEIRSEGNFLMDQIVSDIRKSSCIITPDTNSLRLYSASDCSSSSMFASYIVSSDQNFSLLKSSGEAEPDVKINSDQVKIRSCSTCNCTVPAPGFIIGVTSAPPQRPIYDVTLNLTQSKNNPRSDFCGKITIKETVKPRN